MIVPRWYQEGAVYAFFDYVKRDNSGHPIIAMPTGTGKSLVIAFIVWMLLRDYCRARVMMVTHVQKLIEQNGAQLLKVWGSAPIGIHSAGLNERDISQPIIYGGVQSIAPTIQKAVALAAQFGMTPVHFGWRDLFIIDECHLLSPKDETQYMYVINELRKINPDMKVLGLSATPYRMKQGMLTDQDGIFTDICYDITDYQSFNRLVAEGHMARLISKPTQNFIDMNGVKTDASGEFRSSHVEKAVDKGHILERALRELVDLGRDRRSWIVFNDSIKHAEETNEILQALGIESVVVHSKIKDCDRRIRDYQNGMYQCLVNKDMCTTGFDHPMIDLIGDLQPTNSAGKHVQKNGRGTRPYEGKNNCLVADFARNIDRLGPINDPLKPKKPGEKQTGDAPVKLCKEGEKDANGKFGCGAHNHASVRFCDHCGWQFPFEGAKIFASASTASPMRGDEPVIEYLDVTKVLYSRHEKRDSAGNLISPPSMRVTYICGVRKFEDWVCFEHPGHASKMAKEWWRSRHFSDPPATTEEALKEVSKLRSPAKIRVHTNEKYPRVLGYEYR